MSKSEIRRRRALEVFTEFAVAPLGGMAFVQFLLVVHKGPSQVEPTLCTFMIPFGILYALLLLTISGYQGPPRMLWITAATTWLSEPVVFEGVWHWQLIPHFCLLAFSGYIGWAAVWWTCADRRRSGKPGD